MKRKQQEPGEETDGLAKLKGSGQDKKRNESPLAKLQDKYVQRLKESQKDKLDGERIKNKLIQKSGSVKDLRNTYGPFPKFEYHRCFAPSFALSSSRNTKRPRWRTANNIRDKRKGTISSRGRRARKR